MEDKSVMEDLHLLKLLRPFQKKDQQKAWIQFWTAIIPFFFLFAVSFILYDYSKWLSLLVAPFIATFLSRLFVLVHDSGHMSLFRTKRQNDLIGNIAAFLSLIPFTMWVKVHNDHHFVQGNLNKRHKNSEVWTLTVEEYQSSNLAKKALYRFIRSRYAMLFLSGIIYLVVFRIPSQFCDRKSSFYIIIYDLLYAAIFISASTYVAVSKLFFLLIPPYILFYTFAAFVFYAQHQFEDAYWEKEKDWNFVAAGGKGATYLKFPKLFQWITGNVGFHHVHHLNPVIPNFNLEEAHAAIKDMMVVKVVYFFEIWKLLKLKVWDTHQKKLVGFPKRI